MSQTLGFGVIERRYSHYPLQRQVAHRALEERRAAFLSEQSLSFSREKSTALPQGPHPTRKDLQQNNTEEIAVQKAALSVCSVFELLPACMLTRE